MGMHAAEKDRNALKQRLLSFPTSRPVKTHRPAHKRPLMTTGDSGLSPTHTPTMAQTPEPFVLSATCVMQNSAPVRLRMWCKPGNLIHDSSELQGSANV